MIYSSVSTGAATKTKTETTLTWEAKGNFWSFSQIWVQIGSCAFMLSMLTSSRFQKKCSRVSSPGNLPLPKAKRENGFSLPGWTKHKSPVHHHARLLWRWQVEVLKTSSSGSFNETTKEKRNSSLQATSQYWDTFARMAFPCLDEPSIKAQFVITLAIKGNGRWKYTGTFNVSSILKHFSTIVLWNYSHKSYC